MQHIDRLLDLLERYVIAQELLAGTLRDIYLSKDYTNVVAALVAIAKRGSGDYPIRVITHQGNDHYGV